jgi:hypothetical protein
VYGDTLEEEQGRTRGVEGRRQQGLGDRVGGEVRGNEAELRGRQAKPGDPLSFVRLGGRVVDLASATEATARV